MISSEDGGGSLLPVVMLGEGWYSGELFSRPCSLPLLTSVLQTLTLLCQKQRQVTELSPRALSYLDI